jgi:DNA-directed RNA polymerase specialized sigma24 family protein
MTPERRRDFEHQWPAIQSGLKSLLARKKVPAPEREDLIQETALRLYGMWGRVDPSRSPWPLAVTIALNLVRDGSRHRPIRELSSAEVPETADLHEVERAGLARVELGRVRAALGEMSPAYRQSLLVEVGDAPARADAGSAAQKMTRVRARRKLAQLVEKVSAVVTLRHLKFWRSQWFTDLGQWMVGAREGILGSIPCIACLAVGVTTAVATHVAVAPAPADALPRRTVVTDGHGAFAAAPRLVARDVSKGRVAADDARTGAARRTDKVRVTKTAPSEEAEASAATAPAPGLPAPPEMPEGDEALPVENPLPGNGDESAVERVRDSATKVAAQAIEGLPGL